MAMGYVLYNPLAGDGCHTEDVKLLELVMDEDLAFYDITRVTNYAAFLSGMAPEDFLVIAGGDGTLNRFVNDTRGISIPQQILYFPMGSGNCLARDLGAQVLGNPVSLNDHLRELPTLEVQGTRRLFLTGVGFGAGGHFRQANATVTVDGVAHTYKKVCLAATVRGRFWVGIQTGPEQGRDTPAGELSMLVVHGVGRLGALCLGPSLGCGTHGRYRKRVSLLKGRHITVEFDRPVPLQMDGESLPDTAAYSVRSGKS